MSISRPDPASPEQVADASFSTGRRGFDQNEVRDFLRMVSAELGRLRERELFLERELQSVRAAPDVDPSRLDDEALTQLLGEETVRVLNAARESAHEIREKAERSAARILMEASEESARMREEAEVEASRRRTDAANDAEAELSMAKQQGREMVNEARAYRERVLSELARRRELAREQIEQLVHGRDRLMQVFERARLVAVDVVAEMQPLGEPDEYVNLQPSTGPVPVMVARQATDDSGSIGPPPMDQDAVTDESGEPPTTSDDGAVADADTDIDTAATVPVPDDEPVRSDVGGAPEIDAEPEIDGEVDSGVRSVNEVDSDSDSGTGIDEVAARRHDSDLDGTDATEVDPTDHVESVDVGRSEGDGSGSGRADVSDVDAMTARGSVPDQESSVDDVVVDLFARLRADADDHLSDDDPSDPVEPLLVLDHDLESEDHLVDADVEVDVEVDDPSDDEVAETTVFDQRDADLAPLIVAAARKLKRVLADEQNEVLDALRRSDPVRSLDDLLPWASEHAQRYAYEIADDLLLAANSGAAIADPERVATLTKAKGRGAVGQASEMIARWLVEPLRDRLERSVADGDGDNPAITKKVRAVYREWKTQHIDEQLDDVVRAAHGRGLLAALGPDAPVEWRPDPGRQACPDCDDNRLAGAVAAGQEFPTGHTGTPAHPGCRCMLVPVGR